METIVSNSYFGDSEMQAQIERLKDILGNNLDGLDVFPYVINCELPILSSGGFNFPINQNRMNQSNTYPLNKGLLDSDAFFGYAIAITIQNVAAAKPSSMKRWQWGNPIAFNTTAGSGTGLDMETFFNAFLNLNVSNVAKIQNLFTNIFRNEGQPAVGQSATAAWSTLYPSNVEFRNISMTALMGADENEFQLQLVTGTTQPDIVATTNTNTVGIQFKGIRIPNGANAYRAFLGLTK